MTTTLTATPSTPGPATAATVGEQLVVWLPTPAATRGVPVLLTVSDVYPLPCGCHQVVAQRDATWPATVPTDQAGVLLNPMTPDHRHRSAVDYRRARRAAGVLAEVVDVIASLWDRTRVADAFGDTGAVAVALELVREGVLVQVAPADVHHPDLEA